MKEEALKLAKYLDRLNGYMDMSRDILDITQPSADMIRKLVAELDKQGEPVAWQSTLKSNWEISHKEFISGDYDKRYWNPVHKQQKETYFCEVCNRHLDIDEGIIVHDDIVHPDDMVFAPQTKPLSDEEIQNIWNKSLLWALNAESFESEMTHGVYFARAIEERHGIK